MADLMPGVIIPISLVSMVTQEQALLKKVCAEIDIGMICPLHGPVWRTNLNWYIDKYHTWSTYTPEEKAVLIVYASVYGDTVECLLISWASTFS